MSTINWVTNKKKYVKLPDLAADVEGKLIAIEESKYSPVYVIQSKKEVVAIIGSKDLNSKMMGISIGTKLIIGLEKLIPLQNGKLMAIAKVGIIGDEAESSLLQNPQLDPKYSECKKELDEYTKYAVTFDPNHPDYAGEPPFCPEQDYEIDPKEEENYLELINSH